jgi:hypothetical protein
MMVPAIDLLLDFCDFGYMAMEQYFPKPGLVTSLFFSQTHNKYLITDNT